MDKIKTELRQLKPKLIIVTYAVGLLLLVINFNSIMGFVGRLLSYFSPLFWAIGLAFALNVPMTAIEKFIRTHTKENNILRRFSRILAIVGAIVIVVVLLFFLGMVVLPEFFASIGNIFLNLTSFINSLADNIASVLSYFNIDVGQLSNAEIEKILNGMGLDYSMMIKEASNWILGTGQGAFDYLVATGNSLFMFFMAFTISIYLLASKEKFICQIKKIILAIFPYDLAEDILNGAQVANDIFANFIGGKCVECVVVGVMVYILLALVNIPFAILIACLCGALTIIPVFGSLVATIIGCLLLLSVNLLYPFVFFLLYWLVQIIDGNFIYPKFIGSNMGLPAVWILTSVLVFGSMYGVLGALLAAPTTACLYTFFSNYIHKRLRLKKITVTADGQHEKIDDAGH